MLFRSLITLEETWTEAKSSHKISLTSKIILNFLIASALAHEFIHIFSSKENIMLSATEQILFVKTYSLLSKMRDINVKNNYTTSKYLS